MPLTAAITGFHTSWPWGRARPGSSYVYGSYSASGISLRSMPVQNARSPAPVSTTTRTSSSSRTWRHTASISSTMVVSNALWTSGRSSVTVAMPSACS